MAKTIKKTIDVSGKVFLTGVNLRVTAEDHDGIRYEAGDDVPDDLTEKEYTVLVELGAIEA